MPETIDARIYRLEKDLYEARIYRLEKDLYEARSDLREQEKTCMTCKHGRVLCLKTEALFDDDEPCNGSWEEK